MENLNNSKNRRFLNRANLDCDVTLYVQDLPVMLVTAMNLSASGVYCISSQRIGELTMVEIVLRINGSREIQAKAVVIREEELQDGSFGIGLFFTRLPEEDRNTIISFISDSNPKY